jgi:hypothetical protein
MIIERQSVVDALGQMLSDIQLIPGLNRTLTCIVKG